MNYVYFSPHFPPNYVAFSRALKALGVNVLGLGDEPYENLPAELRAALGEYYRVSSVQDYDQLYRALGHFAHRHGRLERLESHNEHWLESDARLRTDFNIPGFKADSIARVKRKSLMKAVFQQCGVAAARGALVPAADADAASAALRGLAAQCGYPLVVKPDVGVGAWKTYKLHNDAELENFLANCPAADYYAEEFIQGVIVSFDGLVDQDGEPVFYTAHVFSQGIMETVNQGLDIAYHSLREIPADLEAAGRKLLKAFEVRERFFHFEFFRTADERLVALEVNMRPPGGLTTDMFNYANDIDVYREYANVVVHNRFAAGYSRPYHCCYVGRKHLHPYRYRHDELLARLGGLMVHHQPISGVFSGALGNYGYLLRSPHLEEVLAAADCVREREA